MKFILIVCTWFDIYCSTLYCETSIYGISSHKFITKIILYLPEYRKISSNQYIYFDFILLITDFFFSKVDIVFFFRESNVRYT